jgi:hypothetical protein
LMRCTQHTRRTQKSDHLVTDTFVSAGHSSPE